MRHVLSSALALFALALSGPIVRAQTTYTWNGGGTPNTNWSTATNWLTGLPVSSLTASDIVLAGTTNTTTTLDLVPNGTFSVRTLTFDATAGVFQVNPTAANPTALQIGTGGIAVANNNLQTINVAVILGANQTWQNSGTGALVVAGVVTATGQTLTFDGAGAVRVTGNVTGGAMVKTGTGPTTLSGTNTPTGLQVNQGTLIVNKIGSGSPIGGGTVTLGGGTLSFRVVANPIAVTGFNQDVVTSATEYALGTPYGTTAAVDGANGTGNFVFYEQGANAAALTSGLPVGGAFVSALNPAVNYQLAPYAGNNVLSLGSAGTTGTLTLAATGSYRSISLLNTGGSGSPGYSFTLNFTDSSTTSVSGLTSPDWFNGANPVIQLGGRLNRVDGTFDSVGSSNPRIYAYDYALSAADQLKTLQSVTVTQDGSTGNTLNIFGLSGVAGSAAQTYANAVVVTASSSVEQFNVPTVTLGPLSINGSTLTTVGDIGSSLSFGATTLTGNPSFFTSAGTTLTLGALADGGTARTLSKTGPGSWILSAGATSLVAGTTVNLSGGTTVLAAAGALGTSAAVTVVQPAVLSLQANQTLASLAGSGRVALGGNTLAVNGGLATAFSGSVTGGALVVSGSSTILTLGGANTLTGTTINSGAGVVSQKPKSLGAGTVALANNATLTVGAGQPNAVTGFNSGTGWNLQGNDAAPGATATALTITDAVGGQAHTAWYGTPIPTDAFSVSFRYASSNGAGADGVTFAIQNQSATAIGAAGGSLGYAGIAPSVAFALNLYSGAPGGQGYQFGQNGVIGTPYQSVAPVTISTATIGSGNEITATLNYDGTNLSGQLQQGANTFTLPNLPIDLSAVVGGTGYMGFTGGTGGVNAQQVIDNFTYTYAAQTTYAAPVSIAASATATINVAATAATPSIALAGLTFGSGANLNVAADASTPANQAFNLSFGATVLAGTNQLSVANNGTGTGTVTLGIVSGSSANLVKAGGGTLVFPAANTYSGNTTVNAGTLTLAGSGSFAASPILTLAAGATLDVSGVTGGANFDGVRFALANGQNLQGNGTVVGPLGIRTGAMLSPGTHPGRLTVSGGVTFAGGAFAVSIAGPTPATGFDQLRVTSGNVDLGTGVATLLIASATGTGYTSTTQLVVIDHQGTGTTAGSFVGLAEGSQVPGLNGLGGFNWGIYYNADSATGVLTGGNDVVFAVLPVPEPATVLGLCVAALGTAGFVRRKRIGNAENPKVRAEWIVQS